MHTIGILSLNKEFLGKLQCCLQETHCLVSKTSIEELTSYLHRDILVCVIIHLCDNGIKKLPDISILKRQFSMVPVLGLIENEDIELARLCGQSGIDRLAPIHAMDHVQKAICSLVDEFHIRVQLKDFSIDFSKITSLVADSLQYIEQNYIELNGVSEIANVLNVSESTLSREFRNNQLIGPKRMLLYFKLKHAIQLMSNEGLSIKEITFLSGFSSAKRFNESFHRVMGCSPGSYRSKINNL